MRRLFVLSMAALLLATGCRGPGLIPAPESGAVVVDSDTALTLRRRADGFYLRFAGRRFNTLETYADRIMREHFREPGLFLDYYADLAQEFEDADFAKRRPLQVEVRELVFESPSAALVQVRFSGEDTRPLRPIPVELIRSDRWEWSEGAWWIQPGRL